MATRTTRKNTTAKTVTVIARYFIHRNKHIVYTFRGSHGEEYCTTVVNGHATGCTCPARRACKHMAHAEEKEAQRTARVEEIAAEGDKSYDEAVELAYAELAPTKKVSGPQTYPSAHGACGHLVKPGYEDELCGGCYASLYA